MKNLSNLPKTSAFMSEILRMYPPAPLSIFRTAIDELKIQEFTFSKGQIIYSCFLSMNYNSKNYNNPEEFSIDRWENDRPDPKCFLPFSGGPRNCIGQHLAQLETKIILAIILKNYRL